MTGKPGRRPPPRIMKTGAFHTFARGRAAVPWQQHPLPCRKYPEAFHPVRPTDKELIVAAKTICHACPVQTQCLEHAMDHGEWHGIWGGMTEEERKQLARARGMNAPKKSSYA